MRLRVTRDGAVREVRDHKRIQRAKNPGTDAVEQLH